MIRGIEISYLAGQRVHEAISERLRLRVFSGELKRKHSNMLLSTGEENPSHPLSDGWDEQQARKNKDESDGPSGHGTRPLPEAQKEGAGPDRLLYFFGRLIAPFGIVLQTLGDDLVESARHSWLDRGWAHHNMRLGLKETSPPR